MKKLKSQQHHWWPKCISKYWANDDGFTSWISPDGSVKRIPPAKLGMIGNGHHIKWSRNPEKASPWDESFEGTFDLADSNFPMIISWLEGLTKEARPTYSIQERFLPQPCSENLLFMLTECIVSLAVRSPRNREASVSLAEKLRGKISNEERNTLIGLNMKHSQRTISDSIGSRGKFAIIFSFEKEFIFGDGFFHNFSGAVNPPHNPMILAPITPSMGVIITSPSSYIVEPRLSTIILNKKEVDSCNDAVQVHSKNMLFFKSEKPLLNKEFTCAQHLTYNHPDNSIESLIRCIPGIPPRNRSFDFLLKY
ncbi:hypothetical protein F9U39_15445 [Pectobacterium versatile]|uniref:hypothetical protein n=1 Tax=Pectobacterium versatile TaxID=2488639 RepID=UPI001B39BA06|nr:hypothetical protein [Pectobacterium versatile]MBQ4790822.1 hypothetical protein [Pectobacterium versatile]